MWVASALGVGGSILAGSALSAGATAYGASRAADAQTQASQRAQDTAQQQYQQTRQDLAPYRQYGVDAGNKLGARLDELTSPIVMDQAALEQTPGYQFTKYQGLKAIDNQYAKRFGGTNNGAILKAGAAFATGLADQTYNTRFEQENTNRTNAYNRLKALVDTGASAAAGTGVLGEKAAYNTAQAQIGAGNAQAAANNAIGGAIGNVGNTAAGYAMYRGLYGGNNIGGGPGGSGGGSGASA